MENIDMARSENNLNAVFTDTASAIRAKAGTTETICPRDFADKINSIETGGGGMKAFFEAGGMCGGSLNTTFDGIINYSDTSNKTSMVGMFKDCIFLLNVPDIDTSNATIMDSMFANCNNITNIPKFNTSKVKSMIGMFEYSGITTIPLIDTSNVTNMRHMFDHCGNLTNIPELNTSKVESMVNMFYYCRNLSDFPNLDTSNVKSMEAMFSNCSSLTTIPLINTSNVTNMSLMFNNCSNLTSLPALNTSNVTNMSYMLGGCQRLTEIPAFDCSSCTNLRGFMLYTYAVTAIHLRNIKVNLNISDASNLTREAIVEVLNNLATVTSTQKLTMGETNLAKLTDEDKAIATNKGWILE